MYGGVSFDVTGDYCGTRPDSLPLAACPLTPSIAAITCSVARSHVAPPPADPHGHRLPTCSWSGDQGVIHHHDLTARLRRLGRVGGSPSFVATVTLDTSALVRDTAVERTLSHELLEQSGGLMLHAAAIEVDGKAVVFVGPKASGKTTACLLARQPWFTCDRLAIAPMDDGWWAWPLRGGHTPSSLPRSTAFALPLGAVFRVSPSTSGRTETEMLHRAESAFDVRETCVPAMRSGIREECRLEAIEMLLAAVPVARLYTVLGDNPLDEIREVLSGEW